MRGVTFDSSVYVSALAFGGVCGRLMMMARNGDFRLDVSEAIIKEVVTVLREDFHWQPYRIQDAWRKLASIGNMVSPKQELRAIKEDPDDDRILECAVEACSEFIVSWDKDLLRLKELKESALSVRLSSLIA